MTVRIKLRGDPRPVPVSQDLYRQLTLDDQQRVFLKEVDHAVLYYIGYSALALDTMPITEAAYRVLHLSLPLGRTMNTEPLLRVIDQSLDRMRDAAVWYPAWNIYHCLHQYLSDKSRYFYGPPYRSLRSSHHYKRLGIRTLAHYMSEIVRPHAPWVPWMPLPTRPRRVLTLREHEVLLATATGYTSTEAAQNLGVTLSTVRKHWRNLHRKLNTTNQIEALRVAHDRGLISLSQPAPAQEVQCG